MKYSEYRKAFSPARLNKYLKACGGNTMAALTLYRRNNKLCQKLYGVLGVFEVVLRNAINEHYISKYSDQDWIRHQLKPGGILVNHPQRELLEKTITELDRTGRYTNDRVVSSVTFGFWTHLFSRRPFSAGGKSLLEIFTRKTKGVGQRAIYRDLRAIKDFRNRIAHHEAICFDSTGAKNTAFARENYSRIIKYVQFLGYPERQLYYGFVNNN